ncbi:hypothetical protein IGI04_042527 [Brassica rapa subsp. trilocularis]|uniref:Retrotransposon Copia-like N-terminal domain-containing protein n=1 Tax=Brassica rapa subsp. trilocularis TaxID=1813537 RepID=A0ABQ7KJ30_BRACM|nr:hypothetical protein IGI04_042527 [Brassica rapa subsp. trilocularis]
MEHGMNMRMKVAVTFKGSNYLVWSRMVKTAVGSKGASSSRSNDDYIKRSDLDALFKMLKENGNTYGYSFGASMIAYKDDHLIRELVERLEARNEEERSMRSLCNRPTKMKDE